MSATGSNLWEVAVFPKYAVSPCGTCACLFHSDITYP